MKTLDRVFAWILVLGGVLHGVGSYLGYRHEPMTMFWALSATQLTLLIAAVNLLRLERPGDRPLAWIAFAGSLAWAVGACVFGALIGNVFDPRALVHGVSALGLAAFSLKAALRPYANQGR
jgi:hypothetical protein